jgi:hypothetical protein
MLMASSIGHTGKLVNRVGASVGSLHTKHCPAAAVVEQRATV